MSEQESGEVKQLKLRIPMAVFVQLEKSAAYHNEKPATRARHILVDQLMDITLDEKDREHLRQLIEQNWAKIRKEKEASK